MSGVVLGIVASLVVLVLIGGPAFFLGMSYGSKWENRGWLRWLKTVKVGREQPMIRERFHAKNGKPDYGPPAV